VPRRSWCMRAVAKAAGPPRGLPRRVGRPADGGACLAAVVALLVMVAAAACSATHGGGHSSGSAPTGGYVASCGTARTAAHVPVRVEVARGHVSCGTAQAVELAYAKAIRSGRAPGNGGGGPVKINGWTCQGFATPVVLHTGKASKCTHDSDEILEVLLPLPSPSAS
jgi:hypothetical protein